MNFKKNQRRIPMNYKKIIPLTFAALSVAGALSACSDSAVVGADVQDNSVALSSSSVINPGSSNSRQGGGFEGIALAAIRGVSRGTAATFFHMAGDNFNQIDSVTAHETYDRTVQSILDYDVTVDVHAEYVIKYDTIAGMAFNSAINAVMRDEDGVVHAAIMYVDNAPWGYSVNCSGKEQGSWERFYELGGSDWFGDTSVVVKALRSSDSSLLEQFRQDCALENGRLYETTDFIYPEAHCMVPLNLVEGVIVDVPETYKDPNWKKYATGVLEGCEATYDFDDYLREYDSIPSSSSVTLPIDVEIFNANGGAAKTMSHLAGEPFEGSAGDFYQYVFPIDSVNAQETFNRAVQSIYDAGAVAHPIQDADQNLPICTITNFFMLDEAARQVAKQNASQEDYEACVALEKKQLNFAQNSVTYVVMKDDDGLFHGPIVSESDLFGLPGSLRSVNCYVQALGVPSYSVGNITEDHNHHKNLMTPDSALAEEFKKDCASENGEFSDETMYFLEIGTKNVKVEHPQYNLYCSFQYTMASDGVLTYSDPNWEKYAKHIVESCVSNTYDTSVYKRY